MADRARLDEGITPGFDKAYCEAVLREMPMAKIVNHLASKGLSEPWGPIVEAAREMLATWDRIENRPACYEVPTDDGLTNVAAGMRCATRMLLAHDDFHRGLADVIRERHLVVHEHEPGCSALFGTLVAEAISDILKWIKP